MPINEIETHPYLELGQINGATKLILGSFPVYECTDPDNALKQASRLNEGTTRFFYGSADSLLWALYRDYVDNAINLPPNPNLILQSIAQRKIAVSDTILSCQRHEYSSEDNRLIDKTFNRQGIQLLLQNGVRKVLCTSKGVLKDLEQKIVCQRRNPIGQVEQDLSVTFQVNFVTGLGGNNDQITGPIARVFMVDNAQIAALAIPSPGAPQRQLHQFGYTGLDWRQYADNYFLTAFNWLNQ